MNEVYNGGFAPEFSVSVLYIYIYIYIGLYRVDRLAVFKNTSGPQSEKIKKTFQRMFKNKGLKL